MCSASLALSIFVFVFNPEQFTLTLRAHGDKEMKAQLRDLLEQAATEAKAVLGQFKGLRGLVPKEFKCITAHEDVNAKVSD